MHNKIKFIKELVLTFSPFEILLLYIFLLIILILTYYYIIICEIVNYSTQNKPMIHISTVFIRNVFNNTVNKSIYIKY